MLKSSDLAQWLAGQLPAGAATMVETGPLSGLNESLERLVTIIRDGGAPPTVEGNLYVVLFRVEIRGNQRDYDSAETLADQVDDALLDAPQPLTIAGWHVKAIRASQRPTYQGIDTAERTTLLASYEAVLPAA